MNDLDQDHRHTIQIVANRTGLSPDVIRAWERRYQAVEPRRSPSRRRLYSDRDVERLRMLRQATLAGRRIGDIANLTLEQLASLIREDAQATLGYAVETGPPEARGYLDRCLAAAASLDSRNLAAQLERAGMELSLESLFEEVMSPLLREMGERWLAGTLSIAHEHMTTSVVRALLDSMRTSFTNPSSDRRMIATAPAGQHHELGAMKAAVVGAVEGWQATYLGCDLPAREIASAAVELQAQVVALSLVYPERDPLVESELRSLGHLLPGGARLVVGGGSTGHYEPILEEIGAVSCCDMKGLRAELRRIAGQPGTAGSID